VWEVWEVWGVWEVWEDRYLFSLFPFPFSLKPKT
jgi:hypothetical protein